MRLRRLVVVDRGGNPHGCRWEVSVPLLTNRFIVYDSLKATAIAGCGFFAIMAGAFSLQGDPGLALEMLPMVGVALLVVFVLLGAAALLVMGNRWRVRFTVDGRGVHWVTLRSARAGLLAALAAQSGHPTARGAATLMRTGDSGTLRWNEIHRVREHPDAGVISLTNRWRVVLRLYCDASDYVRVAAIVRAQVRAPRDGPWRKPR